MAREFATSEQEAVIRAMELGDSGASVGAVAGSGKTWTLREGIVASGRKFQVLAFNRSIRDEWSRSLSGSMSHNVMTFHQLGRRALGRMFGQKLSAPQKNKAMQLQRELYPRPEGIMTAHEVYRYDLVAGGARRLYNLAREHGWRFEDEGLHTTKDLVDLANASEVVGANVSEHQHEVLLWEVAELTRAMLDRGEKYITEHGLIDFGDMTWGSVRFGALSKWARDVVVDEAQDLSLTNHAQVRAMLAPGGRVYAAGDPRQAIYAFRGALSSSFEEFGQRFNLPRYRLTCSFRCPRAVESYAQWYVPDFHVAARAVEGQVNKVPWDPSYFRDPTGRDSLVLCRMHAPLLRASFALLRQGIPHSYNRQTLATRVMGLLRSSKCETVGTWWDEVVEWTERQEAKERASGKETHDDYEDLLEVIRVFYEQFGAEADTSLESFAEYLSKFLEGSESENSVHLSTIHSFKGGQRPYVTFIETEEKKGSQEENLKYVAITRTECVLNLMKSP